MAAATAGRRGGWGTGIISFDGLAHGPRDQSRCPRRCVRTEALDPHVRQSQSRIAGGAMAARLLGSRR
jgi:hypothetical protein